ncbi:MAG: hypothetical protein WCO56_28150 [Verrucomicrobiota bacterium]
MNAEIEKGLIERLAAEPSQGERLARTVCDRLLECESNLRKAVSLLEKKNRKGRKSRELLRLLTITCGDFESLQSKLGAFTDLPDDPVLAARRSLCR